MTTNSTKTKKTAAAIAPKASYRRVVEVDASGEGRGFVEIEEYDSGYRAVTLAGDAMGDAYTGILHNMESVGWQFDSLDSCEALARALIAAIAKARAVGIGREPSEQMPLWRRAS